jgi:hypothetical protein
MINAFCFLLIVAWAIFVARSQTAGGLIHLLLLAGVGILAVQLVRLLRKRKTDKEEAAARLKRRRDIIRRATH